MRETIIGVLSVCGMAAGLWAGPAVRGHRGWQDLLESLYGFEASAPSILRCSRLEL